MSTWLLAFALHAHAEAPAAAPSVTAGAAAEVPAPRIPYERYTLPNGLQVILAEDHSVPFVWTNVWYYVGSKDETPGRSGFAHLFEHLMFQGSEHSNTDYFKPLQKVGATINGTTNLDRTNYFEGVPAEQLPLALWLESDRMGFLLPALDQSKLDNQKAVVRNERRQRYDNVPYGQAWPLLLENVFPAGHPYHIATIGKHEEIEAASLDDVKAFFQKWYVPSNGSLVVCGDFDPKTARKLVERYFGDLPTVPRPEHAPAPAPVVLAAEKVVTATDDVPFEKVWIAWPSAAVYAQGDAELDVLSHALAGGKDSRLYRKLVQELQVAQDVEATQQSLTLQSMYTLEATVAPGHTGEEVLAALDAVLADVREKGVTADEVSTARTVYEVGFHGSLATTQGKADRLNAYAFGRGEPDWVAQDLARYAVVTPEAVQAATRTWLPADKRIVLRIQPEAVAPPPPPAPPPAVSPALAPAKPSQQKKKESK
jgi:predicted Zn-dependent peptidase